MAASTSPLRYPGGKTCLLDVVGEILRINGLERKPYAEPYAGGCGLALALLYGGYVNEIHINDIDPGIWAFWHLVLNRTEELVQRIEATEINVDEWRRQRDVHRNRDQNQELELGFATFFLNRTNRSGIIKDAGVIGGLAQTGAYKIDCRFNKRDLIAKIRRIKKYRSRIHLTNLDALEFLTNCENNLPADTFLCIDPPYYNKGSSLYTSFYTSSDHALLSKKILSVGNKWIITYDNTPEICDLYRSRTQVEFDLNYSVQTKRVGSEVMIFSETLRVPESMQRGDVNEAA